MKQDIKLNMDILSDICNNINNYILAVEDIITAATDFHAVLLAQESVSFHTLAEEWDAGVEENANRLKNNLWSVKSLLQSYIEAMKENVAPVDSSQLMRVDSADIYWNLQQIEWKLYGLSDIYSDTFTSYPDYTTKSSEEVEEDEEAWKLLMAEIEAERARREANYNRMQTFRNSFRSKVDSIIEREMDEMWQIYKSNVAEFEATDDAYSNDTEKLYKDWATFGDRLTDAVRNRINVLRGVWDAFVDMLDGLYSLLLFCTPEVQQMYWAGELDGDVEQRVTGIGQGMVRLFQDPLGTLGAMGQDMMDTYEEEGLAYSIGYIGLDIAVEVAATKGAGKLKGAFKVVDVAEDSTDIGTVAGKLDDVVEGGSDTVTYRRVQGGSGNQSSQQRVVIDSEGNVYINKKDRNLNLSIDNGEHSQYYIENNRPRADIYEFEVPKWLDDMVQEYTIPQAGYNNNPINQGGSVPKLTDPTTPGRCIEFPAPWVEWIEEYATNGRIISGGQ